MKSLNQHMETSYLNYRWEEVSVVDTYYSRLVPDILLAVFHRSALRCCPNTLTPYLRTLHAVLLPRNRACHSCQKKNSFIVAHLNDFHSRASRLMLYGVTTTSPVHHLGLLTFLSTFQSTNFWPETQEWVPNTDYTAKELRKTITAELLYWSTWVSAPQQSIPPSSTFCGEKKKLKEQKTKPLLCLAHKNYQMTWNKKIAHCRKLRFRQLIPKATTPLFSCPTVLAVTSTLNQQSHLACNCCLHSFSQVNHPFLIQQLRKLGN